MIPLSRIMSARHRALRTGSVFVRFIGVLLGGSLMLFLARSALAETTEIIALLFSIQNNETLKVAHAVTSEIGKSNSHYHLRPR